MVRDPYEVEKSVDVPLSYIPLPAPGGAVLRQSLFPSLVLRQRLTREVLRIVGAVLIARHYDVWNTSAGEIRRNRAPGIGRDNTRTLDWQEISRAELPRALLSLKVSRRRWGLEEESSALECDRIAVRH